jgi:putative FmdB family regulatory protein
MPIYEYHCEGCGYAFEMLRRMADADSELQCPKCHSTCIERQFSSFAAGGCGTSASRGFT